MKTIKYIISTSLIVIFGVACTHNFDDYNTNPNTPYKWEVGPSAVLTEILYTGADGMLDRTKAWNGELMQYTVSGTTLNAYHRYSIGNGIMSSTWDHLAQWAADADHMYKLAIYRDKGAKLDVNLNAMAVALTMKVFFLSNLTDVFGDIPCSEAFRSDPFVYDEALYATNPELFDPIVKPKFDTQKEVYTYLLGALEEANSLYRVGKSIEIPSKDLMYGGKMDKWQKFTNSLYLRLLMRVSNRDAEMSVTEKINAIIGDPVKYPIFTSNEDNAALFYSGATPFVNRYGKSTESDFTSDRKIADNIISLMTGANDPRLELYFKKPGGASDWLGLISGEAVIGDATGVTELNKNSLGTYTSPYAFMKYDEVQFILAEAAKRGMIAGGDTTAKEYYEKALRASVEWWYSVESSGKFTPDETIITRFVEVGAKYNNTLERILTQKYIGLFWVGYEAWHEYRRTGYPDLRIGSETSANNYMLPTRFAYPLNTAKTNPVNYQEAVDRMATLYKGKDNMQSPVWWSKTASGN